MAGNTVRQNLCVKLAMVMVVSLGKKLVHHVMGERLLRVNAIHVMKAK